MYESFIQVDDEILRFTPGGPDPVLMHRGDFQRVLPRHQWHVARVFREGSSWDFQVLSQSLLGRIGDERFLMIAARHLRRRGGKAPGDNGLCLADLDTSGLWSMCRTLAAAIASGTYKPGPGRVVSIPKAGKPGEFRELTILNVQDRIVGRAVTLVLGELLERRFSPRSFGFRPGRSTHTALATALTIARQHGRWHWACDDVKSAFDVIPRRRFLDACRRHFPRDVVEFIDLISTTESGRGIRQGSPESPLLANLYFDRFLDQPWQAKHPDTPLIRYADDLLLLCRTAEEAAAKYAAMAQMARSAGTPLKGLAESSIMSLRGGQAVTWLGYTIRREANHVAVRIADKAWQHLEWRLDKANVSPFSSVRASQIATGWINYMGPCFPFENHEEVVAQVRSVATARALEEIPGDGKLIEMWSAAHDRWTEQLETVQDTVPDECSDGPNRDAVETGDLLDDDSHDADYLSSEDQGAF